MARISGAWRMSPVAQTKSNRLVRQRSLHWKRGKQAREAVIASIPKAAYAMSLEELGLSPRVTQHIGAAGIVNVGQLLEYSSRGDEGLLSIPNIGSKALGEIKQSLEKVVGKPVELEPVAVEVGCRRTPPLVASAPVVVADTGEAESAEEAQKLFIERGQR